MYWVLWNMCNELTEEMNGCYEREERNGQREYMKIERTAGAEGMTTSNRDMR